MNSKPKIAFTPNGPYYLMHDMQATPVPNLRRASGEACATVRGVALCRCGASKNKPFCDGTHGAIGFSGRNTADPGKDRRVSYAGKRITILDNRSICSHAGFCTDGLKSVFSMHDEPWIDPDGAKVEEIVATIRKCPSGALGYAIDIELAPEMAFLVYDDMPGVIGRVGTMFGEAGVNIANMAVSRTKEGGKALMAFSIDAAAPAELVERVRGFGFDAARFISLG